MVKKKIKKIALNLGCGQIHLRSIQKDLQIINIDKDEFNKPDLVYDLENGLPFADNSIEEIISSHFLEHISPDKIDFFMLECWRVLKNKKRFVCVVPIGESWQTSPYHKAPMAKNTPLFFSNWNNPKKTGYNYKQIFSHVKKGIVDGKEVDWSDELHFVLEVIKDG